MGTALIALGLPANPLCLWSEYTLATTGAGLPPGPGGALGAAGKTRSGCPQTAQLQQDGAWLCHPPCMPPTISLHHQPCALVTCRHNQR